MAEPGKEDTKLTTSRTAAIRRMLTLAKQERWRIVLASFFLALAASMNLTFPLVFRSIVDDAVKSKDVPRLDHVAAILVVVFLVGAISSGARFFLFATAGERIVTRLRARLYESLVGQEIGFFDSTRTGELTNRLSSDTTVLQDAVSVNVSVFLRNLAMAGGGIGMLLYTSPILTLLMLSVVPPVAIGAVFYGRRVRKLSRAVQDALAKSSEVAEETLSGIRTVRSFAAEASEAKRYSAQVDVAYALARKRVIAAAIFFASTFFLGSTAGVLVLWYGAHLLVADKITVGALISFLLYTIFVGGSLSALSEIWADFMRAAGAAERVFELIDRKPAIPTRGGLSPGKIDGRIAFEAVGFAYPSRSDVGVLREVSFVIEPGERVALVGPSGAGKSTIASLLLRLYDPVTGRIALDGRDLRELDPSWIRRNVGTVSQEPILFSNTVAENIRYGREGATDEDVRAAARAANAIDFVSAFPQGFETLVGERGIQLSGGQKQRVAIARAVLKDPRILILDEATSALDAESEHLVKEALDNLMKGRTTLVIAHRLSTVRDADRVLVLEGGRVVQAGTHDALVHTDGLYRKLVERQFASA